MSATWGPKSDKTSNEKVLKWNPHKKDAWRTNGAWREDVFHLIK